MKRIFSALGNAIGGIYSTPGRSTGRPTGAALRNPADPIQAARIEAAAVKRARRAVKYAKHCQRHSRANHAHQIAVNDLVFNPFYIAK